MPKFAQIIYPVRAIFSDEQSGPPYQPFKFFVKLERPPV